MDFKKNVTYIDELIDLDNHGGKDDSGMGGHQSRIVGRAVRPGSGGSSYKNFGDMPQPGRLPPNHPRENFRHIPSQSQQSQHFVPQHEPPQRIPIKEPFYSPLDGVEDEETSGTPIYGPYNPQFSCLQIAEHIKSCPICSTLYNNDRTMYIIAIIVLSIIVIILLKKALEV